MCTYPGTKPLGHGHLVSYCRGAAHCPSLLLCCLLTPHVGIGSAAAHLNHPHVATDPRGEDLLLEGPQQKLSCHNARPTTWPLPRPWGSAPGCLGEPWQACPGRARVSSGAGGLDRTVVSEPQWWPVPWSLQGREGSRSVVLVRVSAGDVPSGSRDLLPLSLLASVGLMEIPAARETPVWAPDPPPGRQPRSEQPQGAGRGAHRLSLPAGSWKSSTASTAT